MTLYRAMTCRSAGPVIALMGVLGWTLSAFSAANATGASEEHVAFVAMLGGALLGLLALAAGFTRVVVDPAVQRGVIAGIEKHSINADAHPNCRACVVKGDEMRRLAETISVMAREVAVLTERVELIGEIAERATRAVEERMEALDHLGEVREMLKLALAERPKP